MLDRASTFAQPEIVELLQTEFIPVAIDQAYQRRQQDSEGKFYRRIASQSPRNDFESTTQGFYIATASGKLLLYNNNRDPQKLLRLMREKLDEAKQIASTNQPEHLKETEQDPRFDVAAPAGGLTVRVHAKVLDGYEPTSNQWKQIFQEAISRDNLWITAEEHQAIVRGAFPKSLQRRIARYHLVDNTRGEPPMWKPDEIQSIDFELTDGEWKGSVALKTKRGTRGYEAELRGEIRVRDGRVTRFDAVCLGEFWGEGPFTRGAPPGRFPLAISFTLADGSDIADKVPPQGSRGWVEGYLR